jgi:hypothetical protein
MADGPGADQCGAQSRILDQDLIDLLAQLRRSFADLSSPTSGWSCCA